MIDKMHEIVKGIYGKPCNRKSIGEFKSISLGFGEKQSHDNEKLADPFYCEWEIGTYNAAWRIHRNDQILLGSGEEVDSDVELHEKLNSIEFGNPVSIESVNAFDVRVAFDCGAKLDFFGISSHEDEIFHIFTPNSKCLAFSISGWSIEEA